MSRKHNRRDEITQEVREEFRQAVASPLFLRNYMQQVLRPRPWFLPKLVWVRLLGFLFNAQVKRVLFGYGQKQKIITN